MNYEAATAAMRAYFAGFIGATPVAYDDMPFDVPNALWVRFNVSHADGYQSSIGAPTANRFRRDGLIVAQVFQPSGKASKEARQKADQIVANYLNVAGTIHYYDVQAREIGDDGAGWYQINVLIYFRYDHIA